MGRGVPTATQMPKPMSRSLKDSEGKQDSFYSEVSFMRKLRMFIRGAVVMVMNEYYYLN